jgi:membrane protein DedA with SNARE-associated domain
MVQAGLADMASAMKDSILRFWAVEHITGMIIGIALVTVGYSTAKRAATDAQRYKRILIWFGLGILVVLATIPWPFLEKGMGRGWL